MGVPTAIPDLLAETALDFLTQHSDAIVETLAKIGADQANADQLTADGFMAIVDAVEGTIDGVMSRAGNH